MTDENQTMVPFFILKGISDIPDLQAPIFILILFIYLLTLGGNMTILLLVYLDRQLHTPMYFFLGNLALMDMSSVTITLNKTLINFISGDQTISFFYCMAEIYIYSSLTVADMFVLTSMSYDRYVAICNPLKYPIVMNNVVCVVLALFSWVLGFTHNLVFVILLVHVSCYRGNIIDHFFCDPIPIMELSCSGTSTLKIVILMEGAPVTIIPFSLTFTSYIFIISTIIRIRSSTGRRKTFYTCSSHLTVVCLLYLTIIFVYFTPTSKDRLMFKKVSVLCNTVAVPLLNPIIYSLKNKDMKSAFTRQLHRYKGAF